MSDLVARAAAFAEKAHAAQLRKYTGEAYFVHLREVAAICAEHGLSETAIAAAYLHDVIEDTPVTYSLVKQEFGQPIADMVLALTNEGPRAGINREQRHAMDLVRLSAAGAEVHCIKCADLMSNTASIVQHDPSFARTYLPEKREILTALTKADRTLWRAAWACLLAAEATLEAIKHPAAG